MLRKSAVLLLLTFFINGVSLGQDIVFNMTGELELRPPTSTVPGLDANGFDGANFEFEAVFANGAQAFTFPMFGGVATFEAQSATFTVTGAPSGSNGTFTPTQAVLFRPGDGGFGRSLSGVAFAPVLLDGTTIALRAPVGEDVGGLLESVSTFAGDTISVDRFGIPAPTSVIFSDFEDFSSPSDYGVVNLVVTVTSGTPVVLGDVNLDGNVNFLDISSFISVLSSGGFQVEADIDQNETVNFLDISPFIAILSGS